MPKPVTTERGRLATKEARAFCLRLVADPRYRARVKAALARGGPALAAIMAGAATSEMDVEAQRGDDDAQESDE